MNYKISSTSRVKPVGKAKAVLWSQSLGKIVTASSFCLSGASLLMLALGPAASGYELDIYGAYPWPFWVCLCLAMISGIVGLALNLNNLKFSASDQLLTIAAIALPHLLLILLPMFRGYFLLGRGDALTHLGAIKDIVSGGRIGEQDFYPASHLWVAGAVFGIGLEIQQAMGIYSAVLYVVYVLGMFLLARQLGGTNAEVLLVTGLATLPLYNYYSVIFIPSHMALSFTPLALAIYLHRFSPKARPLTERLILLLLLFLFPYAHVLGALLLIVFFLCFEAARWLYSRRVHHSEVMVATPSRTGFSLAPSLIVFVAALTWFWSFWAFRSTVSKAYNWFWEGVGTPPIETISSSLERAGLSPLEIAELLVRTNGQHLIYLMLASLAGALILRRMLSRRLLPRPATIALIAVIVMICGLYLATLLGDFSLTGRGLRLFTWPLMAIAALSGLVFGEIAASPADGQATGNTGITHKKVVPIVLTACMVISGIIGIFNEHDSPLIRKANHQVTQQDMAGMARLLELTEPELPILSLEELPYRSARALYGVQAIPLEQALRFGIAPPHFGYDQESLLGQLYPIDVAIPMTGYSRSMYTQLWPDVGWVTVDDLKRLSSDPSVSRVYANGDFEVWYVAATTR
jgi:hypothetical protein